MEVVEFRLEEPDLVALAKYQMENSPKYVRRYRLQRWGLLALFALLALAAQFVLYKPAIALYTGALGLFLFGLYPFYYRWLVGRTLRQIAAARLNPAAFAPRKLRLRAEGMEQMAGDKRTMTAWDRIGDVTVTPDHAFVAIDGVYGLVIPRKQVKEERFQGFVKALRAGRFDDAAGDS